MVMEVQELGPSRKRWMPGRNAPFVQDVLRNHRRRSDSHRRHCGDLRRERVSAVTGKISLGHKLARALCGVPRSAQTRSQNSRLAAYGRAGLMRLARSPWKPQITSTSAMTALRALCLTHLVQNAGVTIKTLSPLSVFCKER